MRGPKLCLDHTLWLLYITHLCAEMIFILCHSHVSASANCTAHMVKSWQPSWSRPWCYLGCIPAQKSISQLSRRHKSCLTVLSCLSAILFCHQLVKYLYRALSVTRLMHLKWSLDLSSSCISTITVIVLPRKLEMLTAPRNARMCLKCNSGLARGQSLAPVVGDATFSHQAIVLCVNYCGKQTYKQSCFLWKRPWRFSRVHFLAVKGRLPPTLIIKFANCLIGCSGWIPVMRQVVQ